MKQLNILLILSLFVGMFSCNDDKIFEDELYKKVFALVSHEDYNVVQEVHKLTGSESIGYIAASCGGTTKTEEDIIITLVEDDTQLDIYNRAIFDADEARYAKFLPKDKYEISSYKITIPAGETLGKMMVRVYPEGLSPDSSYFIALKVSDYSAYELNEVKSTVLYRVLIENDYATQEYPTEYVSQGFMKDGPNKDEYATRADKQMHPLGWNRVRIMAGNEPYQKDDVASINKGSIILEVTEDNSVRILPYKDDQIEVRKISGDEKYSNTFYTETSYGKTFNVFLLYYEYKIPGKTVLVKEELRRQIN